MPRSVKLKPLGLTLLALGFGGLSGLAYPRFDFWPLIFVSVAGLFWLAKGRSVKFSIALGLVSGMAFYVSQIYWISQYLGPVPLIALAALQALLFTLGFVALTLVWRLDQLIRDSHQAKLAAILTPPLLATTWVAREWVSTHWPYGGFPWSRIGMSQSESPLRNFAFLGGISLISFVVALIAAFALKASAAVTVKDWKAFGRNLAAVAVIFSLSVLIQPQAGAESGKLRVAAVQGNANAGLFANPVPGSIFEKHLQASRLLEKGNSKSAAPDVVIWPENSVDVNPLANPTAAVRLAEFVNGLKRPLILGTITQRGEKYFNSSLLWQPDTGLADQYDKKRPVPFAEYVPDRKFWASLAPDLIGLIWHDYTFGTRDGIFKLANAKVGVNICFEIAVDELNRDLVAQGAQIIVSQTNNSDFGHSDETYQQAAIARLRAIETGRTVVNDSTVGVTAVFAPDGSVIKQIPAFQPGYLIADSPLRSSKTPAFWLAPATDAASMLAALSAIGAYAWMSMRKRRYSGGGAA